jgi:hypothetical protein
MGYRGKLFPPEGGGGAPQGDPLSPLLFVLAADLLQTLINEAYGRNIISLPLNSSYGRQYPIVQYTDDTLLIMHVEAPQLVFLKSLLQTFASSTGLKVNFGKSFLVPINVSDEKTTILSGTLGCQIGTMPFNYLGLSLGTTKPTIQEFMPLLTRIEKRLMGITPLASYAGRLTLYNSVISSLPTDFMSLVQLPINIIEQINKYRRHYLWRGSDLNKKGKCLAAWSKVQRPKGSGGLGIIDVAT